jgi:hypothetical protein
MKPVFFLLSSLSSVTLVSTLALSGPGTAWAAGTDQLTFDERIALANAAHEDERFHPYPEALHNKAGPQIARLMRRCGTTQPGARSFALVADIDAGGHPQNIVARPNHGIARCFARGFASMTYLKPPAAMEGKYFPIMVRVGHWR